MKRTSSIALVAPVLAVVLGPAIAHGDSRKAAGRNVGFGAKIGLNSATLVGDDLDNFLGFFGVETRERLGLGAGAFLRAHVHDLVSLQPELLYMMKGASLELGDRDTGAIALGYLDVPLLARVRFPLGGQFEPFAFAGPSMSIRLGAETRDEDGDQVSDLEDATKDIVFGLVVGAGVSAALSSGGAVTFELRYATDLTTAHDAEIGDDLDITNRVISFMLGFEL